MSPVDWATTLLSVEFSWSAARARKGHDTAAPPTRVMNSRRLIADLFPERGLSPASLVRSCSDSHGTASEQDTHRASERVDRLNPGRRTPGLPQRKFAAAPFVRLWHECEVPECPRLRRCWRNSGHEADVAQRLTLTRFGHSLDSSRRAPIIAASHQNARRAAEKDLNALV